MSSRGRTAGMDLCGSLTWKRSTEFRSDRSWPCRDCLGALLSLLFSCSAVRARVSGFHSMFLSRASDLERIQVEASVEEDAVTIASSGTPVDGLLRQPPHSSYPASLPPLPEVFRSAGDQCVFRAGVEAVSYQCSPVLTSTSGEGKTARETRADESRR